MKVSTKSASRFLSQEDVPAPFIAIIQDCRVESLKSSRGDQDKYVLYFTVGKPMVFNVGNRKTVVDAYGAESDNWRGRPVEIYVDPNVMMGSERTGGIRVRIPAAGTGPVAGTIAAAPFTPPPADEPAKPALFSDGNGSMLTLGMLSTKLIGGYDHAGSKERLDQWAKWGRQYPWTEKQNDLHEDRYNVALDRLAETAAIAGSRARTENRAVTA